MNGQMSFLDALTVKPVAVDSPQPATESASTNPFSDADYINVYTRAEAIEDGVLKDVSKLAKEAGFKIPVAIELDLYARLDPDERDDALGQDFTGRMWDVLNVMREATKHTPRTDRLYFQADLQEIDNGASKKNTINLCAVCLLGDNFEPVITIELLR